MFKPVMVDGIAVGQPPTAIATAVMGKPCPMCATVEVLRYFAKTGAPAKAQRVKHALFKAGLKPHTCTQEA